jgi:hypothetical protein
MDGQIRTAISTRRSRLMGSIALITQEDLEVTVAFRLPYAASAVRRVSRCLLQGPVNEPVAPPSAVGKQPILSMINPIGRFQSL